MLLVQLSDVHYGSMFREGMLRRAIDEINSMDPDVVLVTSDLTEEGLMVEFQKVTRAQIDAKLKIVDGDIVDFDDIVKIKEVLHQSDIG